MAKLCKFATKNSVQTKLSLVNLLALPVLLAVTNLLYHWLIPLHQNQEKNSNAKSVSINAENDRYDFDQT